MPYPAEAAVQRQGADSSGRSTESAPFPPHAPRAKASRRQPNQSSRPAPAQKRGPAKHTLKVTGAKRTAAHRLSALDAAAKVLESLSAKDAAAGLSAGALIARMERTGLWTSPSGKTPGATLYAAMIREAAARKGESRFSKVAPGRFSRLAASRRMKAAPAAQRKGRGAPAS